MEIIAKIYTDFPEKFGIPRQSGLSANLARIVFEKKYRTEAALKGLDGYSHIWIIWQFSELKRKDWTPTVRPPRLGGNRRMGVFATRSPYRPNPIGLSSVRLEKIEFTEAEGPVLYVRGADILDGTPIYDIKPYLAYTDSHPDAKSGFADEVIDYKIEVSFPNILLKKIREGERQSLIKILEHDPRPSYKKECEKEYGMRFSDYEVFFSVTDGILTVTRVLNVKDT